MPRSQMKQQSSERRSSGEVTDVADVPQSLIPWRLVSGVVGLLALSLLAACSGERPYMLDATTTTTTTTVAPVVSEAPPVRSDCQTVSGPGPLQVVIESTASSNPCVALAAHQRVEFVNNAAAPVEFALGAGTIVLQPAETTISEPVGTLLPAGYTGITSEVQPIIGLWLVDPAEDTVLGERMGLRNLGPISIGNTPADVSSALGGVPIASADGACFVTNIDQDPYSPLLTVSDGAVSMIEVFTPGLMTRSEVGIGTAEADVVAAYGERLEEQPSPDGDPNRKLLVFVPADEPDQVFRLVFEVENSQVISMRNGLTAATLAASSCP